MAVARETRDPELVPVMNAREFEKVICQAQWEACFNPCRPAVERSTSEVPQAGHRRDSIVRNFDLHAERQSRQVASARRRQHDPGGLGLLFTLLDGDSQ